MIKLYIDNAKELFNFFLDCPEQTEVVIQVFILNPLFDFISLLVYRLIDFIRTILKFVLRKNA